MFDYDKFFSDIRSMETYRDENFHGRLRVIAATVPAGLRVLDVACGSGTLLAALRDKGCECVGIDMAPGAVQLARSKGLNAYLGDVDTFEDDPDVRRVLLAPYDVVIFSKSLYYLRKRNALMARLQAGHVILHHGNPYYWKILFRFPGHGVGEYRMADGRECRVDSPGALIAWGASYGYRGRRLYGGWLRGRDMILAFSRPDRVAELAR